VELKDYLRIIRLRRSVIIRVAGIVLLTSLAVSFLQSPQYAAQTRVLITERDAGAAILGTAITEFTGQPERGMQTQVQLIQVRPMLENTIRALDLGVLPEELEQRVTVSTVGQTNIIEVTVRDTEPERASAIANRLSEEFVTWSRDYRRESIAAAADEVEIRLSQAEEQILALGRRIQAEGRGEALAAELQLALAGYTTLAERRETLRIQEQLEVGAGRIVSPAAFNPEPISPNPLRNGLLGLSLGLVLGLGMALLNEYLDNTLKSTEAVEMAFQAPVLGHIPLEKPTDGRKRRLTIVESPGSPAAEAYRVLRNSLDFVNFEQNIKTLLVTSAAPAEGKSTVAANLAASLAQAGNKVVLISCDFRRPTTESFFGLQNMIGLSDVLRGAHTIKASLQRPGDENLLVMTSGKMPPNPSELLGSQKMKELLDNLKEWADWIIMDAPPLLAVADPTALARWADGVLVVTKAGVTTRETAMKGREMLEMVGARILGSVVWGFDAASAQAGYGYYGYNNPYSFAEYYQDVASGRSKQGKQRLDLAARVVGVATNTHSQEYVPVTVSETTAHKLARIAGQIVWVILGSALLLAILAVVIYFVDQAVEWGIIETLRGYLS